MAEHGPSDTFQGYWSAPVAVASVIDEQHIDMSEIEFVQMAEFMPTLGWIARGDGSISWYNKRWHDYCGTNAADMHGWGWQSVHHPDHLNRVLDGWRASIAQGAPFELVFPVRGADGIFRSFMTRAIPLRDSRGVVVRWFGTNTDIEAQVQAEAALAESRAKYEVLTNAMPQMVWSTKADGYHDYFNAQWYSFTGVPDGSTDGEAWNGIFHADDQSRAMQRWQQSLETGEIYEIEYRLRHHSGEYRWVLGRAQPVRRSTGEISRWIGTCTDIDTAKRAAEQNELLSRELSHRIKNIFAVISGLVNLTANRLNSARPVMDDLLGRISALGKAHNFARPHSPHSLPLTMPGSLQGLLGELLMPYRLGNDERIVTRGDDVLIDDQSATPIALVIHELATNAAKYGALSRAEGRLTLDILREDDQLSIEWRESGGPKIAAPPDRTGFGTELADLSVMRQLGGSIEKRWLENGLQVSILLRASRLHRSF